MKDRALSKAGPRWLIWLSLLGGSAGASPAPPVAVPPHRLPASSCTEHAPCADSTKKGAASAAIEYARLSESFAGYSVLLLSNCGKSSGSTPSAISIYADPNASKAGRQPNEKTGWNHVANGRSSEWKNTKLSALSYEPLGKSATSKGCNGIHAINVVLVKKYADWDHQHANGFEVMTGSRNLLFSEVDSFVIDLKINSARTSIPTAKQLLDSYSVYTAESNISTLDKAKVNIGFTFSDGANLKASKIVEIDQNVYFDKWIRMSIKLNSMNFYSEIDYIRAPRTPEDLARAVINSLLVVAETDTGGVLRGKISNWNSAIPETFKELDISVKKIEFLIKGQGITARGD